MPWKIVNLDYAERPHLHLKDPGAPIHLRAFFEDARVEIALGADDPERCFVRATVRSDDVRVEATSFEPLHVTILASILASLDVEPAERDTALAWMHDALERARGSAGGALPGNVPGFPPPSGWPSDLTDEALLESLADRENTPHTRIAALGREARSRGLAGGPEPARRTTERALPTPEVVIRRPRR